MVNPVTKESLAARIADLESGARSLKEDYTLAAYKMLLTAMDSEPVYQILIYGAWVDTDEGEFNCSDPEDRRILYKTRRPLPVVPGKWIPVSERKPENKPGSYEYLVFETLNNRVNHDYWNVPSEGDDAFTPFWNHYGGHVTHWMPLPAAPREVKGE